MLYITNLDIWHQHPRNDYWCSLQRNCVGSQWVYAHGHCNQHHQGGLDQCRHQSENCQMALDLKVNSSCKPKLVFLIINPCMVTNFEKQESKQIQIAVCYKPTYHLTLDYVSQLTTHNCSISASPGVITHSTPSVVHTDLYSAFISYVTSSKPQLTICTRSCMHVIHWREMYTTSRLFWNAFSKWFTFAIHTSIRWVETIMRQDWSTRTL